MVYNSSIFWFRQDLRVFDNVGLYNCVKNSKNVFPIFIFDTHILANLPEKDKRLGFLIDALYKLDKELNNLGSRLYVFHGKPEDIISKLVVSENIDSVFLNQSYGSYGNKRDEHIESILSKENDVDFNYYNDFLLVPIDKTPVRKVFTPFYKQWKQFVGEYDLLNIDSINTPKYDYSSIDDIKDHISYGYNKYWDVNYPEKVFDNFDVANYKNTRNYPDINGTSMLSPYTRFGLISIRYIYNKSVELSGGDETFISELAWREFWHHISYHFPWTKNLEFLEKRRGIDRNYNEKHFNAWKNGMTGYPIVDAGMRQLLEENWIHNRIRMVVASFLTKDLIIDWRWGEKHFADYLIDYDENVNFGNWQRASSVGADPKPLRIFNPILQSKRFDPEGNYIKRYIPELKDYPAYKLHDPIKYDLGYAKPIIDHYENSKIAKQRYIGK